MVEIFTPDFGYYYPNQDPVCWLDLFAYLQAEQDYWDGTFNPQEDWLYFHCWWRAVMLEVLVECQSLR